MPEGPAVARHPIVDMVGEFEVSPAHLVQVCDAVLAGQVQPDLLQAVGFCLAASDAFLWDGDDRTGGAVVAETVFDWSAPETNWPLTRRNVQAFRDRLLGSEAHFERT